MTVVEEREYGRVWRLAFPEKCKTYCRRYRLKNIESRNKDSREYHRTHRLAILARKKLYWIKNRVILMARQKTSAVRERVLISTNKWQRANPHKCREIENRRRARKHDAFCGDPTSIAQIYARARELRQWFDVVVDHIVPLSKGGAHSSENLQIIYRYENARKHTSLSYIPTVVFT